MLTKFPPIILASKSPRRQELLKLMNVDFKVVLKEVDESYPEHLSPTEIALYISKAKAEAFDDAITNEVVITADTIVSIDGLILGKPKDEEDAFNMLTLLSGKKHEVITGVCLLNTKGINSFYDVSEVYFRPLSSEQIKQYVDICKPFDKAGSYGIQEWIGLVGIERINGSYTNVVGLPTEKLYQELLKFT